MPTRLQLADNGNGLVDLTQNDGIYSAIFPFVGQKAGFYSVQIVADDHDGLAVMPGSMASLGISFCEKKIVIF